jgi:hypothetical protein
VWARFLTELFEHSRIDTNRDELASSSQGRLTHTPHRRQLLCDEGMSEINPAVYPRSRRLAGRALMSRIASASPLLLIV